MTNNEPNYPYFKYRVLLTDTQLQALGGYITRCALLEAQASALVMALGGFGKDFEKQGIVFVTGMNLRGKLELAVKLAKVSFPEDAQHPEHKKYIKKIEKFRDSVLDVTALRNDIVHALWSTQSSDIHAYEPLATARITKRHRDGYIPNEYELKTKDLEIKIAEAYEFATQCTVLINEANALRQKRGASQPNNT